MNHMPNSLAARDIAHHLHPYTDAVRHESAGPLVLTGGKGIHVFDENGKSYIEGLAGLWCASLGFGEERLVEAATKQMRKLPYYHSFAHKAPDVTIELAERLVKMAPVPMSHAFFANSGSEANDTVVKMVWYYNNALGRPNKKKIIARIRGYHGVTVASASLTGLPNNHRDFDLPIANILHTDCPHHYHHARDGESERAFSARLAANLERLIEEEGPDTIGGFIAEPFLGAGGVIEPPEGYFEAIMPILERHDILFIVDEVISGFFRTGDRFATQTYGLKPDMISVAKALSAAYQPIGGVMVSEKVYQALLEGSRRYGMFGTGFTYSGHPVPAAVALETQRIYDDLKIGDHVKAVAPGFQSRLHAFADHPLVGETRGLGLIGAVELVEDKAARRNFDPARKIAPRLMALAADHGLIVRALPNDAVAFCPPLIIDKTQIDDMFDRFGRALDDLTGELARA